MGCESWVVSRGSWVEGLRSAMYTHHCVYTFMLLATAVLSAILFLA